MSAEAQAERRPNILWYCTDQQRYDTIGALTQPQIRTPAIDALASQGVAFRRAYTQSPICTPARATFLTGRYPAAHQVYRNGNAFFPAHEKLVTRLFADAGYDCGLVGKLHLSAAKRFEVRPDDGYRAFWWSHHPTPDAARGHDYETWLRHEKRVDPVELYRPVNYFCGPGVPAELHQTTWCSEMAIRFVTEQRDGPWLLSVNPFDPHAPFDAPPEFRARVRAADLDLPLFRDSDLERQRAFAAIDQQTKVAEDPRIRKDVRPVPAGDHDAIASAPPREYDALEVKANYYAMIMLIDDQFARIVETLRATGQLERTIIVFMSDHGELLGDHGLILKGCRFFEGLVRVPLVLSWPGRFQRGLVSDALVETIDVAPTLLEAAGLPLPYGMQGRSLLPILEGSADPARHKPHVVCEYNDSVGGLPDHTHGAMVCDGRYKSVVYRGHRIGELYDLERDPGEFDNLWDDPAARDLKAERLRYHLDAMMGTVGVGPPRFTNY
ncbi:MAG TPA: sulfatase-like hydrolase/transferase [Casimicrobiaceae bacterium]|nr:sulfatase-like hydrolase/transferase [Casimicrobiaceae bacterium]